MKYSTQVIQPPSYLPADVADVKKALNITSTNQDFIIEQALKSAVIEGEHRSGHHFAERELVLHVSDICEMFELPVHPVFEIVSIEFWDGAGWSVFTDYEEDLNSKPPLIWFKSLPAVSDKLKPYKITLKTGYKSDQTPEEPENIPDDIKQAIIFYACQHVIYGGEISERAVKAFSMMLSAYKVMKL